MGYTSNLNSADNNSKTAQAFIDDVSYTGFQGSAAATVTVTATDPNAAEAGQDPGVFTISPQQHHRRPDGQLHHERHGHQQYRLLDIRRLGGDSQWISLSHRRRPTDRRFESRIQRDGDPHV